MDHDNTPIIERLAALEPAARALEADGTCRAEWLDRVASCGDDFLTGLSNAPAFGSADVPRELIEQLDVTETPTPLPGLLDTFERQVLGVHINPASPRFFGYIPGGGLYASALGDYLAAVTDRYSGVFFASPGAARIEDALVRWIADVLGYPKTAGGTLTSGGSLANLAAVVTAREELSIEDRGRAVVYATAQAHHSMHKAVHIAGMGHARQRDMPVDARFRMDASALVTQVKADRADGLVPWLLISSAGTTNTGAIDPLDALSDVAEGYGLWHHIDAAYGGFFVLWDEGRRALSGIDRGDSIAVDPHKGLFLPYGCGCVIVRDHRKLRAAHSAYADYMQDALTPPDEVSPADYSAELTRHFRGLRLWLPLRLMGLAPFRAALEEKALLTRWFHEELSKVEGFECGPYPELSVATFRYRPTGVDDPRELDDMNTRLAEAIRDDGRVFLSTTKLTGEGCAEGAVYLRMAILCFRSHLEHVREALEIVCEKTSSLR